MVELFKNIRKTYAYNVFAWLILFDIGIFLYLMPKPLRPLGQPEDVVILFLFVQFGSIYILIKIFIPIIIFFIEKKLFKSIGNTFIVKNKLYISFTIFSIIVQLLILIPMTLLFTYEYVLQILRKCYFKIGI